MNSDNDNSIFFLTISLVCVWLIVDYVVGKQYVGKFISMLPFMGGTLTHEDVLDDINGDGKKDGEDIVGNEIIGGADSAESTLDILLRTPELIADTF